jgi:hypothetical protein
MGHSMVLGLIAVVAAKGVRGDGDDTSQAGSDQHKASALKHPAAPGTPPAATWNGQSTPVTVYN